VDEIAKDERLKSSRIKLITVALILLVTEVSGASITEANTFIFKIEFKKAENIPFLLFMATVLLTIRYHNYAVKYHRQLYSQWDEAMLSTGYFMSWDGHSDEMPEQDIKMLGVLGELVPCNYAQYEEAKRESEFEYNYVRLFFDRRIRYCRADSIYPYDSEYSISKELGRYKLFQIMCFEQQFQLKRMVNSPEWIDIFGAYFIAFTAIVCYLFPFVMKFHVDFYMFLMKLIFQ